MRIPKLRFPEFRDAGEWEENTFGGTAIFLNGRAYKQEELLEQGKYRVLRVGNFFTNNQWYFSDLELEEDKYCNRDDLLYAWSASFGPRIWHGEKVIYHYHIWKVLEKKGVDRNFLFILLGYETERMKSQSANGLGLMHITKGAIESWKCSIPKIKEQQKIADCLSSIDELITAQTQKLEALKTHKKGLMQQLFPAEGETVPRLRFSEFRDAGEWKSEAFEDIYDFKVTNSFSRDMLNYENGSVKNIHYGDIHTRFSTLFYIEKEQVPFINPSVSIDKIKQDCYCVEGDMVFADASEDLADVGKSIELVNLNGGSLVSGLHTILARQKQKKLTLGFGGHLFKSQRIRKQIQKESQGAKVLGLSSGRLARIKVAYPSDKKEQQKIADCLSSIDELITAQTQKLDTLKTHKKGLMQQLFPAAEEVTV